MAVKFSGFHKVATKVEFVKKNAVSQTSSKMEDIADKVAQRAREYAPRKSGDLESAIVVKRSSWIKGRNQKVWIRIGVDKAKLMGEKHRHGYWEEMERRYPKGAPNKKTSHKSWLKNQSLKGRPGYTLYQGNVVGGYFLKRALKDFEKGLIEGVSQAVTQVTRRMK